jgi:hypothetical protein
METEFFVKALGLWSLCFIKINNSPSLSSSTVVSINSNCSSFLVLGSSDFKDFAALPVDELVFLVFEYLPPS